MSSVSHYLLLDRIAVENANTISSPLTYGFPALSGFMGSIHALNRKLVSAGFQIELSGVLVACCTEPVAPTRSGGAMKNSTVLASVNAMPMMMIHRAGSTSLPANSLSPTRRIIPHVLAIEPRGAACCAAIRSLIRLSA